jgi:hypothetical protein
VIERWKTSLFLSSEDAAMSWHDLKLGRTEAIAVVLLGLFCPLGLGQQETSADLGIIGREIEGGIGVDHKQQGGLADRMGIAVGSRIDTVRLKYVNSQSMNKTFQEGSLTFRDVERAFDRINGVAQNPNNNVTPNTNAEFTLWWRKNGTWWRGGAFISAGGAIAQIIPPQSVNGPPP